MDCSAKRHLWPIYRTAESVLHRSEERRVGKSVDLGGRRIIKKKKHMYSHTPGVSIRPCACFFFQAEDGIRDYKVTGVQTCALPISFDSTPAIEGFPWPKNGVGRTPTVAWGELNGLFRKTTPLAHLQDR